MNKTLHQPSLFQNSDPSDHGVHAQNLQKIIGKRHIVRDVSFSLYPSEIVGLLGPNGAGKTTSFYMVCGLIKATSGKVLLDGKDISRYPVYARARMGLGYLPQESSIFRGLTVEQNIRAVLEIAEPDRFSQDDRLEELLVEFGIEKLRRSPSMALSGGERRRLEIARALASNPRYILLDEPFAGVDPIAVADIRSLVQSLKKKKIGVLITDHHVRETLDVVDRAYIVHEGSILKHGLPDEIIHDPEVRKHYLGEAFSL